MADPLKSWHDDLHAARRARAAQWSDPQHPGCCPRCGWDVDSHGPGLDGLVCPWGASPAARAGRLPVPADVGVGAGA